MGFSIKIKRKGMINMNKKFNYKPLIEYTDYAGRKYIKPEKAGDLKEDMELFRKNGQNARKIFTEIAKSVEENVEGFHLQKVSSWMNQGQVARPYLWVFLKQDGDTENESGVALRVFKNEKTKKVGISMEVSFVERKIGKNTLERQNKVLELPIKNPLSCDICSNLPFTFSTAPIISIKTSVLFLNSSPTPPNLFTIGNSCNFSLSILPF